MMKMMIMIIISILMGRGAFKVIIMVIITIVITIISIISVLLNPHLKRTKHCVREQLSRHSLRIPTHATFNVNYNIMQCNIVNYNIMQ